MSREKARVLLVDDDEDILVAGRLLLKRQFEVVTSSRPEELPELMAATRFEAILLDMNFSPGERSGREGMAWLARILESDEDAVVVLITAHSAVDTAVEAMKLGAVDFVEKPWHNEKLVATVSAAVRLRQSRDQARKLSLQNRELVAQTGTAGDEIIGQSEGLASVLDLVSRAAPTDANVLILGENGTGKELIARAIHRQSKRRQGVFLSVDLGAVTESLFESELFGHRKGAFTNATEDRVGRLQAADGGTLFLDEIGNLPTHLQSKLLTVLEQRQVVPVGGNKAVSIDVRVVSATNMDRRRLNDESAFRQDLLYRLNTVEIEIPPLRARKQDIPELVAHFVDIYGRRYDRQVSGVTPEAMRLLVAEPWPGNVRALRHAIERAVILTRSDHLGPEDFAIGGPATGGRETSSPAPGMTLEALERQAVENALRRHAGNVSHAAKELGITRTSLYCRMEKYGL